MIGDPSLEVVSIGGTPFNVLMQQAVALKSDHLAVDRRKYDSWPAWLRNSLIVSDEIKAFRKIDSFSERLQISDEFKDHGNMRYRLEDFDSAIVYYERALGMWEWVDTCVLDWRRTPINDKDLTIQKYQPVNSTEESLIKQRQVTYLLNIAAAALESKQWARCIEACSAAIDIDPSSAKAFHRRGKARTLPLSTGTVENQIALKDFQRAMELDTSEKRYQQDYQSLKQQLAKQMSKDKKVFGNFFDRAKYLDEEETRLLQLQNSNSQSIEAKPSRGAKVKEEPSEMEGIDTMSKDQLRHILQNIDEAIAKTELSLKHAYIKRDRLQLLLEDQDDSIAGDVMNKDKKEDITAWTLQLSMQEEEISELSSSLQLWQEKKQSLHDVLRRAISMQHEKGLMDGTSTDGKDLKTTTSSGIKQSTMDKTASNGPASSSFPISSHAERTKGKPSLRDIDFTNPTEEMIADAKRHGLDLNDPTIQQILRRRQQQSAQEAPVSSSNAKHRNSDENEEEQEKMLQDAYRQEAAQIAARVVQDCGEFSLRLMLFTRCTYGLAHLCGTAHLIKYGSCGEIIAEAVLEDALREYTKNKVVMKVMRRVKDILEYAIANSTTSTKAKPKRAASCDDEEEEKWLLLSCKQNESLISYAGNWVMGTMIDSGPPKSPWEYVHEAPLAALALLLESQDIGKEDVKQQDVDKNSEKKIENVDVLQADRHGNMKIRLFSFEEVDQLLTEMLIEDFAYCYRKFQSNSTSKVNSKSQDHQKDGEEQERWSQCLEAAMARYYSAVWEEDLSPYLPSTSKHRSTRDAVVHSFSLSSWPQSFIRYARRASQYRLPLPHKQGDQIEHIHSKNSSSKSDSSNKKEISKKTENKTVAHRWWYQLRVEKVAIAFVVLTWIFLFIYFLQSNLFPQILEERASKYRQTSSSSIDLQNQVMDLDHSNPSLINANADPSLESSASSSFLFMGNENPSLSTMEKRDHANHIAEQHDEEFNSL